MDILVWIGYVASGIIALSMTMSSIVKFRLINLAGAALFSVYGILIGALPVALLNGFIVLVDIYYLYGIFSRKERFEYLQVRNDNKYLKRFLEFYDADIRKFFPDFLHQPDKADLSFFILRDMAVAGIFIGHRENENTLLVELDYVIAPYRDLKSGKFIYHRLRNEFVEAGYHRIRTPGKAPRHQRYLKKIGFVPVGKGYFEMNMLKAHSGQA